MGLIIPGFVPVAARPGRRIPAHRSTRRWSASASGPSARLLYSWMLHVAIPIMNGSLRAEPELASTEPTMALYENQPEHPDSILAAALLAAPLPAHAGFTLKEMSPAEQGLRGLPQEGKRRDLRTMGRQQTLPRQRRLLRVPHGARRTTPTPSSTTARRSPPSSRRRTAAAATSRRSASSTPPTTPRPAASSARSTTCWPKWSRATAASRRRGFPDGVSAAAVNGCWQCHGTEVKILANGKPDPATWPNTGIGRINPDGSEGSCAACHSRHEFSAAQARTPDTCGKCHMGPDHPQIEIYNESKHGIAYHANVDKMNLDNEKWVVGEDYSAAPTCATCHMSATKDQPVTHDVGMRISWNNRPGNLRPAGSLRRQARPARQGRAVADSAAPTWSTSASTATTSTSSTPSTSSTTA